MQRKAQDDDLVMSLVELALARPSSERESYLRSACSADAELFDQVRKYVDWDERMDGFLLDPLYSVLAEHHFEPGEVLDGRFRIVREVAQGGMGIVYEAWDEKLDRRIAVKFAKAGFRKRLPPEVRNARDITHPNVCKIFEIHTATTEQGEMDFLAMEFLDGETLAERLHQGPLPNDEATAVARQLCAGLAEAHRDQVIHGDLKSNNVILTKGTDGALRAVITDFGLARRGEASLRTAQSGEAGGTPDYMAPELLRGEKASTASDVYALGVILHELVLGRRPLAANELGPVKAGEKRLTWKPAVHQKWNHILARCLDPDPSRRFRDGAEVAQALAPPRSRRWLFGAAAAVILGAVASGIGTYRQATAPQELIRLAVLPFEADAETRPLGEGMLLDAGDRLSHVKAGRAKLTLVPLSDALQNKVDQPAKARTMLGATHSLSGIFRRDRDRFVVLAYLTDTASLVRLAEWRGEYPMGELGSMPVALAGIVTGALRLPPLAVAATVNAAAYPDYAAGVSLARTYPGLERAIPLLERAVTLDSNSPLTYAKLAEAQFWKYDKTKDLSWKNRALASLKNAEQRNPDLASVRFVSGMFNDHEGQYEQAQADFQRAIELEPAHSDAWRQLGRTYENASQPNQALAAYLKAIEVQPDYFRNYHLLGIFYFNRGDYEEAVRYYKRMVQLAPDLAISHYSLAASYLAMGRYADAESELRAAIGLEETANSVEGLGLVRMYQNQNREAIPYLQRALEIGPKTSVYYINLGTAFRRAGSHSESQEAYRKGLDLAEARLATNPREANEKSYLAYLCVRLGDRRRAESEVAQALQLSRGAANVRWMAALTYEVLGLRDRTLAVIQDAPGSVLTRLKMHSDLADLHKDPRFQELVSHLGK